MNKQEIMEQLVVLTTELEQITRQELTISRSSQIVVWQEELSAKKQSLTQLENQLSNISTDVEKQEELIVFLREAVKTAKKSKDVQVIVESELLYKKDQEILKQARKLKTSFEYKVREVSNHVETLKENIQDTKALESNIDFNNIIKDSIYAFYEVIIKDNIYAFYGVDNNCFKLNDTIYEAVEDASDGYRSYLESVVVKNKSKLIFSNLPIASVRIEKLPYNNDRNGTIEGFKLVDDNNVWLEVGTDYDDTYYPTFVFNYNPRH